MKFPYISIKPIVSEIQAQYKQLTAMGAIDDGMCFQYAASALRIIGGHHYEPHGVYLYVCKHVAPLPKDFYTASRIYQCASPYPMAHYHVGVILSATGNPMYHFPRLNKIRPAEDENTLKYLESREGMIDDEIGYNDHAYLFKIPPGLLHVTFDRGLVELVYTRLKTEEDGTPMVQDHEDVINAVKFFMLQESLREEWILGKIPDYVFRKISDQADTFVGMAQNLMIAEDPAHLPYLVAKQQSRHSKFRLY